MNGIPLFKWSFSTCSIGNVLQSSKQGGAPFTFSVNMSVFDVPSNGTTPFANSQVVMPTLYMSDFSL